jgi:dephospho-CoA kinase
MMLIGITGTLGAGKGTVTDYLVREKGFVHASVSEFLALEAERRGREADRQARHDIANEYRSKGPTGLMEAVYESIDLYTERVVLEPQHTAAEVRFVQKKGGIVLSVDANLETRYERISKRGSAKDNVSFEEFARVQKLEMSSSDPNKNNLVAAIEAADIHLMNDDKPEALYLAVDATLQRIGFLR